MLCDRHHPLKADRHITVTNSSADGSFDYATAWGQSLHIPPRPYLDDPGTYHTQRDERGGEADSPADPDPPPRIRLVQHTDNAAPALPFEQTTDDSDPPF